MNTREKVPKIVDDALFYKCKLDDDYNMSLCRLTHINQLKILNEIMKKAHKMEHTWYSHEAAHKEIIDNFIVTNGYGLSMITFYKHLSILKQVGILIKVTKGLYQINKDCIVYGTRG